MDNFSFVFSLFGLLMGLALAEVIGGFGGAIELRHKIRVGWLSPLLGLLIAFDLTSFWMVAWQVREAIPVNFLSLAGGAGHLRHLLSDRAACVSRRPRAVARPRRLLFRAQEMAARRHLCLQPVGAGGATGDRA